MLTAENYTKGFLIDDEWMAGVSTSQDGTFAGFVLDHASGETVAYSQFASLELALQAMNRIPRQWTYESTSACGTGACGEGAQCGTGLCPKASPCA